MKTVKLQGIEYSVPEWAKFISQDSDGSIYVWSCEPKRRFDDWYSAAGGHERIAGPNAPMVLEQII